MARLDRYVLSHLMMVFGFFSLVLVLIYWINRAVVLFDQLIANGQSATVFLEFTLLTLPGVIRLVMPIAAVAAALYVTNRLTQDRELVVMQATGFGPFRLARPVLYFGAIVGVMVAVLVNGIVPLATAALDDRRGEIAENLTARLLREGEFMNPTDGVNVFIREITPQGELRDVFLSDAREPDRQSAYSAQRALFVRAEDGPKLVMLEGMVQTLSQDDRRLAVTRFSDLTYDLGTLLGTESDARDVDEVGTLELLAATPALVAETGDDRAELLSEGHSRIAQATLAVVAPLLGFGTLLLGGFTRFGIWRQIVGAVLLVIVVKMADTSLAGIAVAEARLWPLVYGGTALAAAVAVLILWMARRPFLMARRPFGRAAP